MEVRGDVWECGSASSLDSHKNRLTSETFSRSKGQLPAATDVSGFGAGTAGLDAGTCCSPGQTKSSSRGCRRAVPHFCGASAARSALRLPGSAMSWTAQQRPTSTSAKGHWANDGRHGPSSCVALSEFLTSLS